LSGRTQAVENVAFGDGTWQFIHSGPRERKLDVMQPTLKVRIPRYWSV
jgi:hypothetical protein